MVKIRLKRFGRKKRPFYRIVVTDIRNRRDGAPIEHLGYYDPIRKHLLFDTNKAQEWIGKGAQASETVNRLMGLVQESNVLVELPQKEKPQLKVQPKEEAKAEDTPAEESKAEEATAEASA